MLQFSEEPFEFELEKVLKEDQSTHVMLVKGRNGQRSVLKRIFKHAHNCLIDNEIEAAKSLSHPNIVKVFRHFDDDISDFLVMEYVEGVNLLEDLELRNYKPMPEKEVSGLFLQILEATHYMHSKGVFHRDFKLNNLILCNNFTQVRIIDFGLCGIGPQEGGAGVLFDDFVGSLGYSAPEVLAHVPYDGGKADTWSLGTILFLLLFGAFPFPEDRVSRYQREGIHPSIFWPSNHMVSKDAVELISWMLTGNPEERPSIQQCLEQKWIKKRKTVYNRLISIIFPT